MQKSFHISGAATLKNTLNRMHWLPISQSSPSVDTCAHNWLSWFFFFLFNKLWFLYDSRLKRCCNLQLISTASARGLHLLLAFSLICSSSSKRFFFFSSLISSTQMAPFIFLLRTPMLLCLRLLSGLLVLVKAKLKMIAVGLWGFFFLLPGTLTWEHINLHWGMVT